MKNALLIAGAIGLGYLLLKHGNGLRQNPVDLEGIVEHPKGVEDMGHWAKPDPAVMVSPLNLAPINLGGVVYSPAMLATPYVQPNEDITPGLTETAPQTALWLTLYGAGGGQWS